MLGLIKRGFLMPSSGSQHILSQSFGYYNQGIDDNTLVFCDERLLQQIDWPVDITPLEIIPVVTPPATTCRRSQNVVLDLMTVLQKLWEMKQLQLTKNGAIRVADLRLFGKKMGWGEDLITDEHCFPRVVDAIINTLIGLRVLAQKENAIELALPLDRFLAYSSAYQVTFFLTGFLHNSHWAEILDPEYYAIPNCCNSRIALLHALRALPDRTKYYSLQSLLPALYDRLGPAVATSPLIVAPPRNFYGKKEQQIEAEMAAWKRQHRAEWLRQEMPFYFAAMSSWLYWLGLVELATPDGKQLVFRPTDLVYEVFDHDSDASAAVAAAAKPPAGPVWVVQPNYDVVVYLDNVTPQQLAFIERHGERNRRRRTPRTTSCHASPSTRGCRAAPPSRTCWTRSAPAHKLRCRRTSSGSCASGRSGGSSSSIQTKTRLIEFPSSKTRDLALQAGLKGTSVGDLFVMVEPGAQINAALKAVFGLQTIPALDYAQPPQPCLWVAEDGTLTLTGDSRDLLLAGQLAQYAEQVSERWRITAASLQAMRQAGVNAKTTLAFLTPRATLPLPPLLEIAIRNALGKGSEVQAGTSSCCTSRRKSSTPPSSIAPCWSRSSATCPARTPSSSTVTS